MVLNSFTARPPDKGYEIRGAGKNSRHPSCIPRLASRISLELTADNARLGKQRTRLIVEMILLLINHFGNSGVDDHLRTKQTRANRAIQHSVFHRDSVIGRLHNRIFFSMAADTVAQPLARWHIRRASRAATVATVCNAPRRSVIARRNNPPVAHNHRCHLPPDAIAPSRHHMGDVHKILIPAGTLLFTHAHILCSTGLQKKFQGLEKQAEKVPRFGKVGLHYDA